MYEEKKFNLNINWKSLLIKLVVLLLIVFVICFIIFRPKKSKEFVSLEANLVSVKDAAINYYRKKLTLKEIGDYDKVTLKKLEENEFIKPQEDIKGNVCDNEKSYAYLTKTRDNEFVLKINMNCGKDEESKTYILTKEDLTIVAATEEIEEENDVLEEEVIVDGNEINEEEPVVEEEPKTEIADNSATKKPQKEEEKNEQLTENNSIEVNKEQTCNKTIRYKHIKYGEWTEGNRTGNSIENGTKEVTYYKFCKDSNCVIDRIENMLNYEGYTATYSHKESVAIYRYIYVVWSNSCCIKGFVNTGITDIQ